MLRGASYLGPIGLALCEVKKKLSDSDLFESTLMRAGTLCQPDAAAEHGHTPTRAGFKLRTSWGSTRRLDRSMYPFSLAAARQTGGRAGWATHSLAAGELAGCRPSRAVQACGGAGRRGGRAAGGVCGRRGRAGGRAGAKGGRQASGSASRGSRWLACSRSLSTRRIMQIS
jgi:hypothetical protein